MKVAFYLANKNVADVDPQTLDHGNPGIGGTPYLFLLVATQLSIRKNNIEVFLYLQKQIKYVEGLTQEIVNDANEAVLLADKNKIDYIVINLTSLDWVAFNYNQLQSEIRLIPWCHNFFGRYKDVLLFARNPRIGRVIMVGREQLDLYRDDNMFCKSDYIFNCVPIKNDFINQAIDNPFEQRGHIVTYMGALMPSKSFHVLAKIWKHILTAVPDAQLNIIGTGKLYSIAAKMGSIGVALEEYEKEFSKYLFDDDGKLLESVHFLGNLGIEKYEILAKSKIGVPNPAGYGETFCITAVEMQAMGCVVTAMKAPGYFDTVVNGNLVSNEKELINSIIELLLSDKPIISYDETLRVLNSRFNLECVLRDWEKVFSVGAGDHIHPINPIINKNYRFKWMKIFLSKLKERCSLFRFLPSIEISILFFYQVLGRLFRKNFLKTV